MSGLGAALAAARREKGLEPEELARGLNVPPAFLEALEAEHWDALPPGQARPLIRLVAERLGIDLAAHEEDLPYAEEPPEEDPAKARQEQIAVAGLGVTAFLLLLWLLLPGRGLGQDIRAVAPTSFRRDPLPQTLRPLPPGPYPVLGIVLPEAPINAEGTLVLLRAEDSCKAEIHAEGGQGSLRTLRRSEPWTLRVKGPFELTLDNAGVVRVEVAGRNVPHGQSVGESWTGRFDAQGRWLRPARTQPEPISDEPPDERPSPDETPATPDTEQP